MNRRHRNRNRLQILEPLEPRLALSGPADVAGLDLLDSPFLGIVATEPADGSALTTLPPTLRVQFDRPIDAFSVFQNDLRLERIDGDGNLLWSSDAAGLILDGALDDSGTQLTTNLPGDLPSTPGTYRLVLSEMSFLMGIDGSMIENLGQPLVLSTFQVAPRGASLDDAYNLGTLTPGTEQAVTGELDFQTDPHDVRLYRFTVPAGHTWRLGAVVDAQRLGSELDPALALFNSLGQVIAVRDVGLLDAPRDPYLFAGLAPGTYYLGVSGVGNLAGQPGRYDPAAALPELVNVERASGAFRLSLIVDPADSPTSLLQFQLHRDDPFDPTPTGFDLQFASLVTPKNGPDGQTVTGVFLVDEQGRFWHTAGAGFDVAQARLSFAIINRLPPGQYTVWMNNPYGLVDLAGRPPVAPGLPPGALATFQVTEVRPANEAADLGIAFLQNLQRGITRSVSLQPGESFAYRMVATRAELLNLALTYSGGAGRVEVITNSANPARFDLDARAFSTNTNRLVGVGRGSVIIRITATGTAPLSLRWRLGTTQSDFEKLSLNGNGQGPALQLRLIAPTLGVANETVPVSNLPAFDVGTGSTGTSGAGSSTSTPAPPTTSVSLPVLVAPIILPTPVDQGGLATSLPSVGSDASSVTNGATGFSRSSPISPSSSLLLALPTGPVGRPLSEPGGSTQAARSTAPTAESVLLAARAPGDALDGNPGEDLEPGSTTVTAANQTRPRTRVEPADPSLARVEPPTINPQPAETPIADQAPTQPGEGLAGWIGALIAQLTPPPPNAESEALAEMQPTTPLPPTVEIAASLDPFRLANPSRNAARKTSSRLDADLGSPAAAIGAAALVAEAHRRLQRWLGKRRGVRLVVVHSRPSARNLGLAPTHV